jgi:hypothetical protein
VHYEFNFINPLEKSPKESVTIPDEPPSIAPKTCSNETEDQGDDGLERFEKLSSSFLAAIPEELRAEVLEQHHSNAGAKQSKVPRRTRRRHKPEPAEAAKV